MSRCSALKRFGSFVADHLEPCEVTVEADDIAAVLNGDRGEYRV